MVVPLTETEREITKIVLDRFLNLRESTPRKPLVVKSRAPEALERLVRCSILKTVDNEAFLPMALAFHYCGDANALRLAKKSVEVVVHALQNLFEVELNKTDFTPADVEAHAQKMYDSIERMQQEFRRRVKTQAALPNEGAVLRLFFGLWVSGQIKLRRIRGYRDIGGQQEEAA